MDLADIADGMIENETLHCIRTSRRQELHRDGKCFNCLEPLPLFQALFCDDACKEDWEKRAAAERRSSRAFKA